MSAFPYARNAANGWVALPNGMIEQWGTVSLTPVGQYNVKTVGDVTYYTHYYRITFPRTYPSAQIATLVALASASYTAQGSMAGKSVSIHRDSDDGISVSKTRFTAAYTTTVLGETPTIHYSSIGY